MNTRNKDFGEAMVEAFGPDKAAVSALMLFSRFWDAINDPIVGGLTDKTKVPNSVATGHGMR